jgi:hypothetical protein
MVQKYHRDLLRIEKALGVEWVQREGGRRHELYMDQEEALQRLAEMDYSSRDEYGYPYDDDEPIVAETERELHNAAEGGAA